jgi:hypothetical protein
MSNENRIFSFGKVKFIDATKEVGTSNFRKRDIVITTDEQYPQNILFQFVQDKCDLLNSYNVGDNVEIDYNLRGRLWTNPQGEDVYFNTIQGWRIKKIGAVETQTPTPASQQPMPQFPVAATNNDEPDDLPF